MAIGGATVGDGDFSSKRITSELPHFRKTDDLGVESKHAVAEGFLTTLRNEIKRRLGISAEDRPIDLPGRVWAVRGVVPSRS